MNIIFRDAFVSRYSQFLSLFGLVVLLIVALVDRGGIHLTFYFLFATVTIFFIGISLRVSIKKGIRIPFYFFPLVLFLLFVWISWFLSPMKGEGIRELLAFTSGVFLFFSLSQIPFSVKNLRKFFMIFLVIGNIEILYAFYVYIFRPFNRLAGTFQDYQYSYAFFPNAFANFSLALIAGSFYFLWTSHQTKYKILSFISLAFSLTALSLTYSRGGLLALFLMVFVFCGIALFRGCFRDSHFWRTAFFALTAVILSFFVAWNINFFRSYSFPITHFSDKISLNTSEKTASVDERLDFWKGSLFLMRERPFFGYGPYSFQYVFPRYQKELLAISDHPHNVFLKIGVENGLLALASFLFFLSSFTVFCCRRVAELGRDKRRAIFFLTLMVLVFFFHNVLDYNLNFLANFLVLWLGLGMVSSLFLRHEDCRRFRIQNFFVRLTVSVFAFLFLFFVGHEAFYGVFYKDGRTAFSEKHYSEAIVAYKKAEPLWLQRRFSYDVSAAYGALSRQKRDSFLLKKGEQFLSQAVMENPFDAFMLDAYAKTAYQGGTISLEEAISYYLEAIELDPLNNFSYYHHIVSAYAQNGDKNLFLQWESRISELLDRYSVKLRDNAHLTVLTDNPRHAFEIYELLAQHALTSEKRTAYLQKGADIRSFFVKKYTEMAETFGLEPLDVIF